MYFAFILKILSKILFNLASVDEIEIIPNQCTVEELDKKGTGNFYESRASEIIPIIKIDPCSDNEHCELEKSETNSEKEMNPENESNRITCSLCKTKQPLEEIKLKDNNYNKTVNEAFYNQHSEIRLL